MSREVKLQPGWLTRDVNRAAERAKSLERQRTSDRADEKGKSGDQENDDIEERIRK